MCCRYYFGEETSEYICSLAGRVTAAAPFRTGDIRPSDRSVILTGRTGDFCAEEMRWGFPVQDAKQLLINARAETAWEKRSFAVSIRSRRCIIAARHFYEWDREKNMVTFTVPGRKIICLAGIWSRFADGDRFTILTTAANASMLPVHDRMPAILPENALRDWIFSEAAARDLLTAEQPALARQQDYEQLSLF